MQFAAKLSIALLLLGGYCFLVAAVEQLCNSVGCAGYDCFEQKAQCGSQGYLLAYGRKYCYRFHEKEVFNSFDKDGQKFIQCTAQCLLDDMQHYLQNPRQSNQSAAVECDQLKETAFESHVDCYLKCNFCQICQTNKIALWHTYDMTDFFSCWPISKKKTTIMSSGVMVHEDCQSSFKKIAEGRNSLRYIIYKIQDKEIVVEVAVTPEDIGVPKDDYDDSSKIAYLAFVKDIKERTNGFNDCRYAVFDFKFTTHRPGAGISKMDKIVFIQLCPDSASIKNRMVYASSASAIKSSLGSEKVIQLQVSDESELAYADVLGKLTDKFRDN